MEVKFPWQTELILALMYLNVVVCPLAWGIAYASKDTPEPILLPVGLGASFVTSCFGIALIELAKWATRRIEAAVRESGESIQQKMIDLRDPA